MLSLKSRGRINEDIFSGGATNTPSLLCVEDYLDALRWAEMAGGAACVMRRCSQNFAALAAWVERTPWIESPGYATRHALDDFWLPQIRRPWFTAQPDPKRRELVHDLCSLLEAEGVAFDIAAHRNAPPGIRIWRGLRWKSRTSWRCSRGWNGESSAAGNRNRDQEMTRVLIAEAIAPDGIAYLRSRPGSKWMLPADRIMPISPHGSKVAML